MKALDVGSHAQSIDQPGEVKPKGLHLEWIIQPSSTPAITRAVSLAAGTNYFKYSRNGTIVSSKFVTCAGQ